MKKLLIILAFSPLFGFGQLGLTDGQGTIIIFNNSAITIDTSTTTIACDEVIPCDKVLESDQDFSFLYDEFKNNIDEYFKHEEILT